MAIWITVVFIVAVLWCGDMEGLSDDHMESGLLIQPTTLDPDTGTLPIAKIAPLSPFEDYYSDRLEGAS